MGAPGNRLIGITGYSAYVPRSRLARERISQAWGTAAGGGEIAVAQYDEDALTMAADAGLACLRDGAAVPDAIYFASTSAPYREKQIASLVATVCDLPRSCQSADFSGSVRAGVSAVAAAYNAVAAGSRSEVLVCAADARLAAPESELEGVLGDGAAAVRIGREHVIAEILDIASVSEEFTHVWRTDEQRFVQAFAGRFSNVYGYVRDVAETIDTLLRRQRLEPKQISRLAVHSPDARASLELAKRLGLDPKQQMGPNVTAEIGSAGCADPLLALAAVLDEAAAGDLILVAGYGEGADAILLRATDELPQRRAATPWKQWLAARQPLPSYEKYLKLRRVIDVDASGEAINNVLERKELEQNVRLHGSRCRECGMVQYPVAQVCIGCKRRGTLASHKLAKRGTIFTFTIDHLIANAELPLPMAVIDLDGGGRLYLQVTDFAESEVEIGQPVALTFRRLHEGGGNHNYYWKARPLR